MKYVEHKDSKKVFLNENEKFDKEKFIDDMSASIMSMSDKILSYDPRLIWEDRQDLAYMDGDMLMWRTNMVRSMNLYDMYAVLTIIERRSEQQLSRLSSFDNFLTDTDDRKSD